MDIQIGKGGNVDLAISSCADIAANFISRSDYIYVESNSSVNGILSSGIICRMLIKFKKGFHATWGLTNPYAIVLSTSSENLMLNFPNNTPLAVSVYYMARIIDGRNIDLAGLAVTASYFENTFDMEQLVIEESKKNGIIDVVKDVKFYFDNVKKSILYLAEPICDISGNAEAVDHFLKLLDISECDVKSLDKIKMSKLLSLLILKSIDQDEKQLIDNVFFLNNEVIPVLHKFAATIKACIDAPGLVLSLCLKDDTALQDAEIRLINHKLQRIEESQYLRK